MIWELAVVLVLAGAGDWLRGAPKKLIVRGRTLTLYGHKPIGLAAIALCAAWVLQYLWSSVYDVAMTLALIAGLAIFGTIGPGHPVGNLVSPGSNRDYEKWQLGILRRNLWLALSVLGAIWFVFAVPLGLLSGDRRLFLLPVAWAIATPAALWVALSLGGGPVPLIPHTDPRWSAETERSGRIWATFNTLRSPIGFMLLLLLMKSGVHYG